MAAPRCDGGSGSRGTASTARGAWLRVLTAVALMASLVLLVALCYQGAALAKGVVPGERGRAGILPEARAGGGGGTSSPPPPRLSDPASPPPPGHAQPPLR